VVDGGKRRIILQVLVTPAEVMENQPALDLIFRTRFRWKLWPRQATGDTTYGTAENIVALEHEGIRAYVPLSPYDQRSPYFTLAAFRYDAERDVYICPNNAILRLYTKAESGNAKRYNARAKTCNACPLKAQCTPGKNGRSLAPNNAEDLFERVRGYHETEAYQKAMRKRQVWVEPLFAEAKDWHGMRRFRLRQLWRVNCEALLIAAGQNLKRLLNKRGWGRRPLPSGAATQLGFYILSTRCLAHSEKPNRYTRLYSIGCFWLQIGKLPIINGARCFSTACRFLSSPPSQLEQETGAGQHPGVGPPSMHKGLERGLIGFGQCQGWR
jgi:hypothetical protein